MRFAIGDLVETPLGERLRVLSCDLHGCTVANGTPGGARYSPESLTLVGVTPSQIQSLALLGYRVIGVDAGNVYLSGNGESVMCPLSGLSDFIAEMTQ
jgi:hypothetical protein